jgi:repressor of nif and glnA expression
LESFPDDVRQFLEANISSVEQLEILRVLGENPASQWIDEEIRKAAQVSAESIRGQLQELQQRGLLRSWTAENAVYCQYGPHSAELESKVARLLELYQQRPVTMIRMVYDKPAASLRNFADAFRIRGKE